MDVCMSVTSSAIASSKFHMLMRSQPRPCKTCYSQEIRGGIDVRDVRWCEIMLLLLLLLKIKIVRASEQADEVEMWNE